MRLLNTSTGLPEEFIGTNIPKYAILSHTWGEEEVSFKDLTTLSSYRSKKGYEKIFKTCQLAKADGLKYAWVDTCCIDKTSSAELSEAINSMYQWYQRAAKCYAYLVDLEPSPEWREDLAGSRWFTRGWTLQELIAPAEIYFYDRQWNMCFRKSEGIDLLTSITGIDTRVLRDSRSLHSISVAQRMSWASRRVTTRVEDEAYCLLGIFDVNMPMLYGEEHKAFLRLQEEIVRICPDLSIFAWRTSDALQMNREIPVASSIFASATSDFAQSGSFVALNVHSTNDFFISNEGIKLHTRLPIEKIPEQQGWRCLLPVCTAEDGTSFGIRLRKCGASQLVRECPWALFEHDLFERYWSFHSEQSRTMYLLVRLPPAHFPQYLLQDVVLSTRSHIIQIVLPPEMAISNVFPWSRWDGLDQVFFVSDNLGFDHGAVRLSGEFDESGRRNTSRKARYDFMLYTVGWANTDIRKFSSRVVPWVPSDVALKDLNDKLEQYDYSTSMVESDLDLYKIPKSSSARYDLANSHYDVIVGCSSRLVNDKTKCPVPFWRLELSWKAEKS